MQNSHGSVEHTADKSPGARAGGPSPNWFINAVTSDTQLLRGDNLTVGGQKSVLHLTELEEKSVGMVSLRKG